MVAPSGVIRTSPTPDPLWFATPSTYTFQHGGFGAEATPTCFISLACCLVSVSIGGSANLATRSARTWLFMEVRSIYLMSKALRIVFHRVILSV